MNGTPWVEKRLDYAGGTNLIYFGQHKNKGASDEDNAWNITKFVYDANNNLTSSTGPVIGKWSERANLF